MTNRIHLKRRLRLLSYFVGTAMIAFPAYGQSINEDIKIVASDASASDLFGWAVAISGTTAIVGAFQNDDAGENSGSAYLFDTITGDQLLKLTADDAESDDDFGYSVAISGTMAIVGAWGESIYGSAYLFDTITGQQLFKLTPSDPTGFDKFGFSVAISGTTAIVGVHTSFNSGSAYLFDTMTGDELFKLTASDTAQNVGFGHSVAISGTTAIVGGGDSAYRFDTLTGQELFKLTPSDGAPPEHFGSSIAISGTTAIVGAYWDDEEGYRSGSAYLFDTITGGQLFKLTASDAARNDYFGQSVAISGSTVIVGARSGSAYLFDTETGLQITKLAASDGAQGFADSVAISSTTAIVGAYFDNDAGTSSGSAYLFSNPVREDQKLIASDGDVFDSFSKSIAIDNGVVAVGAYLDDDNGFGSGSAYLFDTSAGAQIAKLLPSDGAADDEFGYSIAINNGIVAAGAWRDDDNGTNSGSAYLFDVFTSEQIAKLLPSDGAARDWFGRSISIANGIVAVGADGGDDSGSAYLFDASTGEQLLKLLPTDGAAGDKFGWSISIANGIVAVGAYLDDDNGIDSGSAYLFDASTGAQITKIVPSDGAAEDRFGYSIAIANGIVAVSAYLDDDNGFGSGSAYLFDASTGEQIVKLLPSDGVETDQFGSSIAIDKGVVAVGARWNDDNGSHSGSAYLYDASTGAQLVKLLPSDGTADDHFGDSIAIDNGVIAVGASMGDGNGEDSGSAYVFDSGYVLGCLADLTGDGVLNFFDVSGFLLLFQLNDLRADFTGDGLFNFFDVSAFLNAYGEGCP